MQNLSNLLETGLWLTLNSSQYVSSKSIMRDSDRHAF